ncbi:MAG: ABC transporter permease subunit [Thermoplasmatota archaeon]
MAEGSGAIRDRTATAAVAGVAFRRSRMSALVLGFVCSIVILGSALGFAAAFPDPATRTAAANALGANVGFQVLYGKGSDLASVPGFTAWRGVGIAAVIAATWGLVVGVRAFRGEEESGRWEILLAGPTTQSRATWAGLSGLAASWLVFVASDMVLTEGVLAAHPVGINGYDAAFMVLGQTFVAGLFVALGAFLSQLAKTRRGALTMGGLLIGLFFLVRAVADVVTGWEWARNLSPLGWAEEIDPVHSNDPWPLLGILVATVILAWVTAAISSRRDLNDSLLPHRDISNPWLWGLRNPFGLAVRLDGTRTLSWWVAMLVMGWGLGTLVKSVGDLLANAHPFGSSVQAIAGAQEGVLVYVALIFFVTVTAIMVMVAGAIGAMREEEALGELDNLLVRPVGRSTWVFARAAVGAAGILGAAALSAVGVYMGSWTVGGSITWSDAIQGGENMITPSIFVLGAGILFFAIAPRWSAVLTYGLIGWSFIIEFIGKAVNLDSRILWASILDHMAFVPAVSMDTAGAEGLLATGIVAGLVGVALFGRRDLASE